MIIILNCNDALKNFTNGQQNKLKADEYAQRYSDVGAAHGFTFGWVFILEIYLM